MISRTRLTAEAKWAADPLGDRPVQIMDDVLQSMSVSLIASSPIAKCSSDAGTAEVFADPALSDFDFIPVESNGLIVGVLDRKRSVETTDPAQSAARELMTPLNARMLLSADASVLDFVENADVQEFCLVVKGRDISEIVTLSDLQKIAARPSFFGLLALLEMLIGEWIQLNTEDDDAWLALLPETKRKKIQGEYVKLQERNLAVDLITATTFGDKIDVARRISTFPGGMTSKADLDEIRTLRNSIFHHHDFAESRESARRICKLVRRARDYVRILSDGMAPDRRR